MNNTAEIYNNILDNLAHFYGPSSINNLISRKKQNTASFNTALTKDVLAPQKWSNTKNAIINSIMSGNNIGMVIGVFKNIEGIKITTNDKPQTDVNLFVLFVNSNEDVSKFKIINNVTFVPTQVNFVIAITTHAFEGSNISTLKNSIRASDYFFNQFTYKEFSINIFDHIYQPQYEVIRNPDEVKEITAKYLIDLSSMGSIFLNDPVNKRLLGLPKINVDGIVKDTPDVYRIFQEQGINYRKVIASGMHNPFTK